MPALRKDNATFLFINVAGNPPALISDSKHFNPPYRYRHHCQIPSKKNLVIQGRFPYRGHQARLNHRESQKPTRLVHGQILRHS